MDIVTHALTGALAATGFSPPRLRRRVAVLGAVGASLPDLDVLIRSSADPLLVLEYHRHFTHSLFFAPIGAALAALLLWPIFRHQLRFSTHYLAVLSGYISACLLDVFTSYGTHLLWPLVSHPIALNMIAVVDPVFTLAIATGLVFTLAKPSEPVPSSQSQQQSPPQQLPPQQSPPQQQQWRPWAGLMAGVLYLGLGAFQLHRAEEAARQWAEQHALAVSTILVKPTLANLVLWRALITQHDGSIQAAGVRPGLSTTLIYPGDRSQAVSADALNLPAGSRARRDLERFYAFSEGYLVPFAGEAGTFGDARYAMLPTSMTPLWGIRVNPTDPNGHTDFFTRRDSTTETRQRFWHMLTGKPLRDTLPL